VHSQRLFDQTTTLPADMKRSSEPYLIAGVKVEEYRKTIPFIVRKEDAILEVGCHFGRTTHLLNEEGRYCIGVDIGPKIIANAKNQYPGIDFAVGDAWQTLALLKLRSTFTQEIDLGYDLVYADIGGLSGADGLLESLSLLESLGNALEPRCIVIKSLCMRQLASRLKFFPDVWDKHNNSTTKTVS
jgi:SAM-dependent methyltransferase